jgi:hypothetical protein
LLCALGHRYFTAPSIFSIRESEIEQTLAGYGLAPQNMLARHYFLLREKTPIRRQWRINQFGKWRKTMRKEAHKLARLFAFLMLGYLALTAGEVFVFVFVFVFVW